MISSLRGNLHKYEPGLVTVDVNGVGYAVSVPLDVWEKLEEGSETKLEVVSYVREDRFELYGFLDRTTKMLFESSIALNGVGPRMGLEICSVSKGMLATAIASQDAGLLSSIKGVGKKTAEKLLVDLKSLAEKHPNLFGPVGATSSGTGRYDQDAVAALRTLGYDDSTIMEVIKNLPEDIETTEERVSTALRSL